MAVIAKVQQKTTDSHIANLQRMIFNVNDTCITANTYRVYEYVLGKLWDRWRIARRKLLDREFSPTSLKKRGNINRTYFLKYN